MADTPSDLGQLAKQITDYQVESPEDVRRLTEMLRFLEIEVADVIGYARHELFEAVRWADHSSSGRRRAKRVVRPLDHVTTLHLMAARRAVTVYRLFCKEFSEELSARRSRGTGQKRTFDWKAG